MCVFCQSMWQVRAKKQRERTAFAQAAAGAATATDKPRHTGPVKSLHGKKSHLLSSRPSRLPDKYVEAQQFQHTSRADLHASSGDHRSATATLQQLDSVRSPSIWEGGQRLAETRHCFCSAPLDPSCLGSSSPSHATPPAQHVRLNICVLHLSDHHSSIWERGQGLAETRHRLRSAPLATSCFGSSFPSCTACQTESLCLASE